MTIEFMKIVCGTFLFQWLLVNNKSVNLTFYLVGYGDYTPNTNFGRLIGITCALLGSALISLTVVSFQNIFQPSEYEAKAIPFLERLKDREHINKNSAKNLR